MKPLNNARSLFASIAPTVEDAPVASAGAMNASPRQGEMRSQRTAIERRSDERQRWLARQPPLANDPLSLCLLLKEGISHIHSYLNPNDLGSLLLTCKQMLKDPRSQEEIVLSREYKRQPTLGDIQKILDDPGLEWAINTRSHLKLPSEINDIQFSRLIHGGLLDSVTSLDLSGCTHVSSSGFEPLGKLGKLLSLNIANNTIDNDELGWLTRLSKLSTLNMKYSSINDDGLEYVAELHQLKQLNLSWCADISHSAGIGKLARLQKLTHLNLACGSCLLNADLVALSPLVELENLDVRGHIRITSDDSRIFQKITNFYYGKPPTSMEDELF